MLTAAKKIARPKSLAKMPVTKADLMAAQALFDLEVSGAPELQAELKTLFILSARQIEVDTQRKAIVIFVPARLLRQFQRISGRLIPELEKKLGGKHVMIVARRRILPKPSKTNRVRREPRPYSRTLTAVHEAILNDVVSPSEIVGRRMRYRVDGTRMSTVYLDPKDTFHVKDKLKTFSAVYQKLTGSHTTFEFPAVEK
eukprot:TRINITY_DN176_c0_g1_i1.p1 TRINITY_DN176_c0_g1~~TRINITY_DN176_c0_g1_i1.p1  ORF type:complete len:199 (-),score=58.10 TRINITY_DN176_c0_g1_i1:125-721(-)